MSIIHFIPLISNILDRVIPDKAAKERAVAELMRAEQNNEFQILSKQIDVNMEEAKSPSIFVAGARPATMWVCASVFAYHYLFHPILLTIAAFNGMDVSALPKFDLEAIWPVMMGLLGLGSFRTYEKLKGVARQ